MPITRIRARPRPDPARRLVVGDVTPDLLEPSMVLEESISGKQGSRTHLVKGLDGEGFNLLLAALRSPGMPAVGTIDPVLYQRVSSLRATLWEGDPSVAYVTINYGEHREASNFDNNPDDTEAMPQIEIVSTLESVKTAFDVHGTLLVVDNYIDRSGDTSTPLPAQGGEVEYLLPMHTVILHRREKYSPGNWKSPDFSGTINGTRVFEDPKHFWIANVDGYSDDGGETYNVTYTFQRNPETWNVIIVYRDPETGQPGKDVEKPANMTPYNEGGDQEANGAKVARIYPEQEFRNLQLPANFFGPIT